jgi:tetratricopeptide (TPR) repeat protein
MTESTAERCLQEARIVLAMAQKNAISVQAWQALQERDEHGQAKGPLPYTGEAIALFIKAQEEDPGHIGILHHLAICTHAHAWDLELAGSPEASAQWEKALGYWRILIASPDFWQEWRKKLAIIDSNSDQACVDNLRTGLYNNLLEIHVEFIRSYFAAGLPERAADHIRLVGRARIPPALRSRLMDTLYTAITISVPQARIMGQFEAALSPVEQFLVLYPDHLQALQLHIEICREWLAGLSYIDNWPDVLKVKKLAEPRLACLAAHKGLSTAPLSKIAIEELVIEIMRKYRDRAEEHADRLNNGVFIQVEYDEAERLFDTAAHSGRIGLPVSTTGSGLRHLLAHILNGRVVLCLNHEMPHILVAEIDMEEKLHTQIFLLKKSESLLEEAIFSHPEEPVLNENLENVRMQLNQLLYLVGFSGAINMWDEHQ